MKEAYVDRLKDIYGLKIESLEGQNYCNILALSWD